MENDIEDKLSTPNSWIPLKAIKKIMGLENSPRQLSTDRPKQIPNCLQEDIPNKWINPSNSFVKLHNKYTEGFSKDTLHKTSSHEDFRIKEKEEYIKTLENKIKASESETNLLKNRLIEAEKEIYQLNKTISSIKTEHMIKLQTLHEQHERKLHKTKKDIDYLLKEMNNRSNLIILDDFIGIHLAEMERCRQNYEEIIKGFLKQINKRNIRSSAGNKDYIASMSISLEEKLENELSNLRERYENQIEKLKELVTNDSLEAYYEDELSTGLNSERATSEMKGSLLESTLKLHPKSTKSSFFHN
ncbi:hypothetical protein SteCoe_19238 [Stentor coeruleus]|uniref:Uncharacterized protein n=1 Tax=Stentor coeruleus TaxID=5963 RepID=A0A1R2BUI4_9CILI|nr:hypothetical protein SteCoe_19238 [Stentor coeruleus]